MATQLLKAGKILSYQEMTDRISRLGQALRSDDEQALPETQVQPLSSDLVQFPEIAHLGKIFLNVDE